MLDGIVFGDWLMEGLSRCGTCRKLRDMALSSVCLQCVGLSVGYHTKLTRNASISSDVAERGARQFCALIT